NGPEMPKGVEHMPPRDAHLISPDVNGPEMPKGVEHFIAEREPMNRSTTSAF
ncbi:MAG: hypothetical protein JWM11_5664, partial [Planctomycetaceae bacterium]|nr:hypothetical protein [Planctomycetaceae bacterium]